MRSRVGRAVGTGGSASCAVSTSSGAGRAEAGGLISCQYSVLYCRKRATRCAPTYAIVVTSGVRSTSPVVVGVNTGISLVGEVAGVGARVGRAVGVAASVSRPAGVDIRVEGVASVSGVRASGSTSSAETSASVVGG